MAPHESRTEPASAGAHDARKKQTRPKNPAPCLNCSLSKVRCIVRDDSPGFCERCKKQGRDCVPHVPYSKRSPYITRFRQEKQQQTSPAHMTQQQMYHYWLDSNAAASCTPPDYSSYSSYQPYSTSQLEPTLTYNMGQEQSYAYGYLTPPQLLNNQWQQPQYVDVDPGLLDELMTYLDTPSPRSDITG